MDILLSKDFSPSAHIEYLKLKGVKKVWPHIEYRQLKGVKEDHQRSLCEKAHPGHYLVAAVAGGGELSEDHQ